MTVFLGGGFAAKYLHGGGNFSVPLQWMLGLRRLKLDAFWLEHLPSEGNTRDDERKIDNFRRQLRAHGLGGHCLLYHKTPDSVHDRAVRVSTFRYSESRRELRELGPSLHILSPGERKAQVAGVLGIRTGDRARQWQVRELR